MSDINISAILNHPLTGVVVAIYIVIAVAILIVYPKYRRDAINNIVHAIVVIVCIIALGSTLQDTLTDHLRFTQEVSDFSSIIEQISSPCLAELEEGCRLLLPINAIEEAKIILNNYSIPYPNYENNKEGYLKWAAFISSIRDYAMDSNLEGAREFGRLIIVSKKRREATEKGVK